MEVRLFLLTANYSFFFSSHLPAGEERGLPGQVRLGRRLGSPQSGLSAASQDAPGGGCARDREPDLRALASAEWD